LIVKGEVISIKVPYPDSNSALAKIRHMYICHDRVNATKRFVKCQTWDFSHIVGGSGVVNFLIEGPDVNRNPFTKRTLIDCDKVFSAKATISKKFLTQIRPDVCDELVVEIQNKLNPKTYLRVKFTEKEFAALNENV
jgi:hypothetical protein